MNEKQKYIQLFLSTFLVFIFLPNGIIAAQVKYCQEYKKLSCPEKRWVFFHPFIAKKAFRITQQVREVARTATMNHFLDGDENGGQTDAFRHAFWMASLSQKISWRKARRLGIAHEKGNYKDYKKGKLEESVLADSVSSQMDLFNNEIGIQIGRQNKSVSDSMLISLVCDSLKAGNLKVIRKNKKGEPLDCDEKNINQSEYFQQWNIPKCLVKSDYIREQ